VSNPNGGQWRGTEAVMSKLLMFGLQNHHILKTGLLKLFHFWLYFLFVPFISTRFQHLISSEKERESKDFGSPKERACLYGCPLAQHI
jgi:hypothetical protein